MKKISNKMRFKSKKIKKRNEVKIKNQNSKDESFGLSGKVKT